MKVQQKKQQKASGGRPVSMEDIENYKKTPEELKQDREAAKSLTVVDAVSVGNSFESIEE